VTLLEELATVVGALDEAGIEYALVGGLAVAVWGAPRATQDIDLLIRPESVDAAVAAVEPHGFRFRALPMTFKDGMSLQRVSKIDEGALLTLDLILVDDNLEPAWRSRQRFDVDGTPVWVISREALIQMKAAAGRPQDALDIQNLEELDR
jgi:predicted nucleotidyltransferase